MMTSHENDLLVVSVRKVILGSLIALFFSFHFLPIFCFAPFVLQRLPSGSLQSLKNLSFGDDSNQRRASQAYITACHGKLTGHT